MLPRRCGIYPSAERFYENYSPNIAFRPSPMANLRYGHHSGSVGAKKDNRSEMKWSRSGSVCTPESGLTRAWLTQVLSKAQPSRSSTVGQTATTTNGAVIADMPVVLNR